MTRDPCETDRELALRFIRAAGLNGASRPEIAYDTDLSEDALGWILRDLMDTGFIRPHPGDDAQRWVDTTIPDPNLSLF